MFGMQTYYSSADILILLDLTSRVLNWFFVKETVGRISAMWFGDIGGFREHSIWYLY